jgi:hypothetical protein
MIEARIEAFGCPQRQPQGWLLCGGRIPVSMCVVSRSDRLKYLSDTQIGERVQGVELD